MGADPQWLEAGIPFPTLCLPSYWGGEGWLWKLGFLPFKQPRQKEATLGKSLPQLTCSPQIHGGSPFKLVRERASLGGMAKPISPE